MGRDPSQLSGPDWLPGELDAIFAMEAPCEEPTDADPWDDTSELGEDLINIDLAALFGADGDLESGSVPNRFAAAMDRLCSATAELAALAADPGLAMARPETLVEWSQQLERSSNRMQVPGQSLINLMESAGCRTDGPLGLFAQSHGFLSALLGIPFGEAKARVRAAQLLAPIRGVSGEQVGARYPVLAAAQASGEVSSDRIDLLTKALVDWEKLVAVDGNNVTPESLAEAGELLAQQARVFGGRQLGQVVDRVADWLVPDGMLDDRPAQDVVRGLAVHPIHRGAHRGMYRVEGRLTSEAGAKVSAVLDSLARPQPVVDVSGRVVEADRRERDMRLHDALEEVMDRSLRAGDLPAHGGMPTTLILIAEEDEFRAVEGSAVTETGDVLPMELAVALADEAEVVRTAFSDRDGEVLNLGRTRRLASHAQTLALAARDGGCTFPGCNKSPKWCQRHHLVDWAKGGRTDLANLTLLCPFHHHRFARHGWSGENLHGRVGWRPPKIIDPERKLIFNSRHRDRPLIA